MATSSTMDTGSGTGQLLYGLVPADVEVTPQARGLSDPVGPVGMIRHGEVAALVSETPLDVRLGRPEDLLAYRELLDGVAVTGDVPVLPVRFGTVLGSTTAVSELLAVRHDEYKAALAELEGRVEYVVRARYVERALLAGVLAEEPEAADLRDQLRGLPEDAAVELRIRLGEIVAQAVEAHRAADTERLVEALGPYCLADAPLPAHHEQDAARVAFLVERGRRTAFTDAVRDLAETWRDWATMRTIGPTAAWDFVPVTVGR
ncbi:GvpL/GvpF family gas vesicle protein [Plantactinospora endophytica]|uniref:Gas vesicle protein n=1 Tax=Plantactinospora endophytica TaxID=673535 RepID=A0ABQ4EDS8_9ACTN|nr:GvpL/GvpF family gas vesicle protein [Plantactinospora endophytica]GIG92824.1 gas vesicle protein [Plantactinospora endophytica]